MTSFAVKSIPRLIARLYLGLSDQEHINPNTPEDIHTIYDCIMGGEGLDKDTPNGILFRKGGVIIIGNGRNNSYGPFS